MQGLNRNEIIMAERKLRQQAEADAKNKRIAENLAKREEIMEAKKLRQQAEADAKNKRIAAARAEREARRNN
jgi:hypothetical protein